MGLRLGRFATRGSIKDGKLVYDNERYVRGMLARYEDTPKVRVTIERERGVRTHKQNNYYWGIVLVYIAEHMGEQPEDLHEIFKARFLKRRRVWRGADITVLKSTTQLTSDEFGSYIDRCIQEGAELGVVVPPADKDWNLIESTTVAL